MPPLPASWTKATIWQYAAGNPAQAGNCDKSATEIGSTEEFHVIY
jgi:hypothetical protein